MRSQFIGKVDAERAAYEKRVAVASETVASGRNGSVSAGERELKHEQRPRCSSGGESRGTPVALGEAFD